MADFSAFISTEPSLLVGVPGGGTISALVMPVDAIDYAPAEGGTAAYAVVMSTQTLVRGENGFGQAGATLHTVFPLFLVGASQGFSINANFFAIGARSSINRVYDSVAGKLVRWVTTQGPDPTGSRYPGPGVFGVTTLDYVVEG